VFFPSLRFEHPVTGQLMRVTGLSYVFAALLGPFYVLRFGRGGFLKALLISIIYGVIIVGIVGASTYTTAANGIIMLVFLVPAAIAMHGRTIIFSVRDNLGRRGWMINLD